MKKLLSILALALCFVACQNDGVETVSNSDLVDVVLTVDAPELGITRADDVVKTGNSAYGAIDFMTEADWADFDLRYILEVYAEDDTNGAKGMIYSERLVNCLDKYAPTSFALRLVPGRTYKFVVFADFVREGNAELTEPADKLAIADLYYNTADLRNISAITSATYEKGNWDAMNDNRDAYFVSENVLVNTNLSKTLTLTRPFAKLRVIATDLSYIEGYTKPAYVDIAYHDTDVYSSFNAVNGELQDVMTTAPAYSYKVDKSAPYTEGYDKFATNQTLFTDYLFAKNEQTPVNFTMFVYEAAADGSKGKEIHHHDFNTQIPIERNHLTTIIGDLLTVQENIQIEINDDFVENEEIIRGWGDDNVDVTAWEAGKLNSNGDYEFIVKGDNDFLVTVNGAAVENDKLAVGTYVLAEDAEEGAKLTFTVQNLKANETTRALVDVKVIGGTMVVEYKQEEYHITLDLVLEYDANEDARHAVYVYEGAIEFGATLATPEVTTTVDGLNITLTWAAIEGATSYTVTPEGEMPVVVEGTTYTYTALEYATEYTFTVVAVGEDITSVAVTVKATTGLATLATPVVKEPVVEGKTINLEWDAIEGAAAYSITVGTDMPAVVNEPKYTYTAADYETEYTFSIVAIPADETKFNASEAAVVTVKSGAEEAVADKYYIYVEDEAGWGTVYLYTFGDLGEFAGTWPGTKMTKTTVDGKEYYAYELTLTAESENKQFGYIFNNGSGQQTSDQFAIFKANNNYFFSNVIKPVDPVEPATAPEFQVAIPEGFTNVIFVRMNPASDTLSWDNKWSQTADLTLGDGNATWYSIPEGEWTNGSWSAFDDAENGYLYFTPNNNWKSDNAWFAAYFFGNGDTWVNLTPYEATVEPTVLATPVVEAAVEGNVITLTWTAIENAAQYGITVGTEMPVFVEETTYTFTGEYETEYTFNVVAVPADEATYAVSEAAVVTATTEAEPVEEGPTEGSLLTIKEFINLANTEVSYQITGVISNLYNTKYGNCDLTDETGTIRVYGILNEDGSKTGAVDHYGLREGDTVTLQGKYTLYEPDTHEIVDATVIKHIPAPFISADPVTVDASSTEATINVSTNVAWTVTCDADWVSFNTTDTAINVTFDANTGEERTATFILSGEGIEVDVKLTQAAYGATDTKGTFASENFLKGSTDSTNSKYYLEKVNVDGTTYDCLKLGTSSVIGKYTTTAVGESGDLTLSFYAVAWNNKSGKLNIYLDGVKVGETITLKSNAGANNQSPYTVTFEDSDYYSVKLTGVTESSKITFETVSGAQRAIICGVQLY